MERAVELACRVARAPMSRVLITGPNGAGKERIAQIVHANSALRAGPFVAVNCGAIPAELIEAELFGAEAGAYTGAHRARVGRFEAANGGTLFLDEIGDLPLAGQVKLLRVLETGQFEQLGSSRTRNRAVRVISATNADLPALIREGRFREDLYYRLNVIEIAVPPLADRPADILPLARHFLGEGLQLSEDAAAALLAHDWPGNVRELRNSIERAKLLARERIVAAADLNLPAASSRPAAGKREFEQGSLRGQFTGGRRQHQPGGTESGAVASGFIPPYGAVQSAPAKRRLSLALEPQDQARAAFDRHCRAHRGGQCLGGALVRQSSVQLAIDCCGIAAAAAVAVIAHHAADPADAARDVGHGGQLPRGRFQLVAGRRSRR